MRTDNKLRSLVASALPWWVYMLGGVSFSTMAVGTIDTMFHHTNKRIVERGEAFVNHPKIKKDQFHDIYRAIVSIAYAEQAVDNYVQDILKVGGDWNPIYKISESKAAHKLAKNASNFCRGGMAFGCVVGYTAILNGMLLGFIPVGTHFTNEVSKLIFKKKDLSTADTLVNKKGAKNITKSTTGDVMVRFINKMEEANKTAKTRSCPSPQDIAAIIDIPDFQENKEVK